MERQKNYSIETLRGIAILLVVAGHVIGSKASGGMQIEYPSILRYIYLYIDYIQMPLFTAIAGWVYALKPVSSRSVNRFIKGKVIRLLIPLLIVSSIYYILQSLMPGVNAAKGLANIWQIYLFPYSVYWYLSSLFLIFCVVALLDSYSMLNTLKKYSVVLLVSIILVVVNVYFNQSFNLFSYQGTINQLPYMLVGIGINRFSVEMNNHRIVTTGSIIMTISALFFLNWSWIANDIYNENIDVACRILVLGTLWLLFMLKMTSKFFIYFGTYSYSIYLFHIFFTGGIRIILMKLGISSIFIMFVIILLIAVLAPILIEKILVKNKESGLLFLGIATKKP